MYYKYSIYYDNNHCILRLLKIQFTYGLLQNKINCLFNCDFVELIIFMFLFLKSCYFIYIDLT